MMQDVALAQVLECIVPIVVGIAGLELVRGDLGIVLLQYALQIRILVKDNLSLTARDCNPSLQSSQAAWQRCLYKLGAGDRFAMTKLSGLLHSIVLRSL